MHGVKRLFAWMLPRFDPAAGETGADQPAAPGSVRGDARCARRRHHLPAARQVRSGDADRSDEGDRSPEDRRAAPARLRRHDLRPPRRQVTRLPVVLHEHANLTATPWFQQIADRLLAPARRTSRSPSPSRPPSSSAGRARCRRSGSRSSTWARRSRNSAASAAPDEIAATRHELGLAPDDFAVGTVTRLHDSKGNEFLVAAARDVIDARPEARFVLVGEGPLLDGLKAQAHALGLGDRFRFHGFHKDTAAVLSAFDLSVFPSLWEGTPLTAFEALAAGKPIVSTDADGLLDILEDGVTAWVVPKRDAASLARTIVHAIDHPQERGSQGPGRARGRRAATTSPRSSARWSAFMRCSTRPRARRTARACCRPTCRSWTAGGERGGGRRLGRASGADRMSGCARPSSSACAPTGTRTSTISRSPATQSAPRASSPISTSITSRSCTTCCASCRSTACAGKAVLEVGCGAGIDLVRFAAAAPRSPGSTSRNRRSSWRRPTSRSRG